MPWFVGPLPTDLWEIAGVVRLEDITSSGLLDDPGWRRSMSVVHTRRPLVLTGRAPTSAEGTARLARALATAPTVTVLVGSPEETPDALLSTIDVCISTTPTGDRRWVTTDHEPVVRAVEGQPEAAFALAALLRVTSGMPLGAAVSVEAAAYAMLLASRSHQAWLAGRREARTAVERGEPVIVERRAGVLHVELNRPEARNALNTRMRDALLDALQLAALDTTIERIELSGAGPAFCAGGDLEEFGTVPDPATAFAVRHAAHPGLALHDLGERAVVRVHGACIGAGIEIPAFSPRVESDASARFSLPELSMGLIPGAGGTASITARIGRHRTAWMALTGEAISADQALEWGLVDAISTGSSTGHEGSDGFDPGS